LVLIPSEDTLPKRFVEEPLEEGPAKGLTCPIAEMLKLFYEYRKIDPITGYPSKERLKELNIDVMYNG
jgi:aldehyde:ferredoxin oxidoreductase